MLGWNSYKNLNNRQQRFLYNSEITQSQNLVNQPYIVQLSIVIQDQFILSYLLKIK